MLFPVAPKVVCSISSEGLPPEEMYPLNWDDGGEERRRTGPLRWSPARAFYRLPVIVPDKPSRPEKAGTTLFLLFISHYLSAT
ncbi:hypothetical protein NHX12_029826 [Muraenolepis orangiensis]|uniref:Uncharacterized protein n=1 Tax=Muraenolepis orangiensis TaxID=630683 RepID=A0A9Q0IM85_9TELE|nr:hypothetical protein NHX12_029826 [Muraenolepis orangiensis]